MALNISGSSQQYLSDLDRTQSQLQKAQAQISSGLRLQQVSDDPTSVTAILLSKAAISANQQVQTNLNSAQAELSAADTSIQSAITAVQNALTLAAQGANSTQSAQDRPNIAQQVIGLQQTLVSLSRTQVAGRYIFSGDQDGQPAYQLDSTEPTGVKQLFATTATRTIQDLNGTSIAVARTAQQIFDTQDANGNPVSGNVFGAIGSLITALQNNDQAGISAASDSLNAADDHLNTELALYGAAENRVSDALTLAQKFLISDQADLSRNQDADLASAALDLTTAETQQQATLSVAAKVQQTPNLFSLLA